MTHSPPFHHPHTTTEVRSEDQPVDFGGGQGPPDWRPGQVNDTGLTYPEDEQTDLAPYFDPNASGDNTLVGDTASYANNQTMNTLVTQLLETEGNMANLVTGTADADRLHEIDMEIAARNIGAPEDFTDWEAREAKITGGEQYLRDLDEQAKKGYDLDRDQVRLDLLNLGYDKQTIDNQLLRLDVAASSYALANQSIDIADVGLQEAIDLVTQRVQDVDYDEAAFDRDILDLNDLISRTVAEFEEVGLQRTDLAGLKGIADTLRVAHSALITSNREQVEERHRITTAGLGLETEGLALDELGIQQTEKDIDIAGRGVGLQRDELGIAGREIGLQEEGLDISGRGVGMEEERLALQTGGYGLERERLGLGGEEVGLGEEDVETERQRLGLQRGVAERQFLRGRKAVEQGAAGRGASFTTGLREDVGELKQARTAALADIDLQEQLLGTQGGRLGLAREGLDVSGREIGLGEAGVGIAGRELGLERERLGLGEEGLGLQRERLGLGGEGLGLQREGLGVAGEGLGLEDERLATQTTRAGLQRDELDIAGRGVGLQQDVADETKRAAEAGLTYDEAQATAAQDQADLQYDTNLRALDLAAGDLWTKATALGRNVEDVQDAISRLDTTKLGYALESANLARQMEQNGLDKDQIALELKNLGYDRIDIDNALLVNLRNTESVTAGYDEINIQEAVGDLALTESLAQLDAERGMLGESKQRVDAEIQDYTDYTEQVLDPGYQREADLAGDREANAMWMAQMEALPGILNMVGSINPDQLPWYYENIMAGQIPQPTSTNTSAATNTYDPTGDLGRSQFTEPGEFTGDYYSGWTDDQSGRYPGDWSQEQIDYFNSPEVQIFLAQQGG